MEMLFSSGGVRGGSAWYGSILTGKPAESDDSGHQVEAFGKLPVHRAQSYPRCPFQGFLDRHQVVSEDVTALNSGVPCVTLHHELGQYGGAGNSTREFQHSNGDENAGVGI